MKKRFILFPLFFIYSTMVFALSDFDKVKYYAYQYVQKGDYDDALDVLSQYKKVYPKDVRIYNEIAQVYINMRKYDRADNILKEGISVHTTYCPLYLKLSDMHFSLQHYDLVIKYLQTMLTQCDRDDVQKNCKIFYKTLGKSYYFINDFPKAIIYLKKSSTQQYNDGEVYKYLSFSFENINDKNNYNVYKEIYNYLLEHPSISEEDFYSKKGILLLKNKIFIEGIQTLLKVYEDNKKDYALNYNLGLGYLLINEYKESIYYLQKACLLYKKRMNLSRLIKMDKTGGKLYLTLSLAYDLNKENKKASITFTEVKLFNTYLYETYLSDYKKGIHSQLYKELNRFWED